MLQRGTSIPQQQPANPNPPQPAISSGPPLVKTQTQPPPYQQPRSQARQRRPNAIAIIDPTTGMYKIVLVACEPSSCGVYRIRLLDDFSPSSLRFSIAVLTTRFSNWMFWICVHLWHCSRYGCKSWCWYSFHWYSIKSWLRAKFIVVPLGDGRPEVEKTVFRISLGSVVDIRAWEIIFR